MKQFKNILCVINPDTTPANVVERIVTLAENNQARLTAVYVAELTPVRKTQEGNSLVEEMQRTLLKQHAEKLEALFKPYCERVAVRTDILTGTPFLEVIREVLRGKHDLVIKIPEQPAWLARLLGGDDMNLLRKCPCPVWMIRPDAASHYQRILAAVDVDDAYPPPELATRHALNRQTLEMAMAAALSDFAELHVVHVWNAPGESVMRGAFMRKPEAEINAYVEQVRQHHEARLDALVAEVMAPLGSDALKFLRPQVQLVKGYPRREIQAVAKQIAADLIVMGTVARTGIPGFIMGNTSESILNQIDCSVLAIKPPGFVTPVTLEG